MAHAYAGMNVQKRPWRQEAERHPYADTDTDTAAIPVDSVSDADLITVMRGFTP